jgi:hypothetical protein
MVISDINVGLYVDLPLVSTMVAMALRGWYDLWNRKH